MGTLDNGRKLGAFPNKLYPAGLDLHRCSPLIEKGTWKAGSGNFRMGAPVMLNANREVVLSDGSAFLGVAKWDKMSTGTSVVVDEEISFSSSGATATLDHGNVSNLQIRSAKDFGGSQYTPGMGNDYTLNTTNGVITHLGGGSIPFDGTVVYVTYTWSLAETDYDFQGKNFWNSNDWVTIQDGRVAVIEAPAEIYTTEFETDVAYTLTGATSNVYVDSNGLFTTTIGSNKLVGHVVSLPAAGDPYLGIKLTGQHVAST